MSLTPKDVRNIAHLARLEIGDAEMQKVVGNLSRILEFVEQLGTADTSTVEPMAHPLHGQKQRLRPDEVTETDRHELYQRNAPRVEAGLYLVPKVIE
jgi:aspartyl-tRNA(Asn)/glutamyl-tRNA(Gln) amidotransferase subunit C